VPDGNGHYHPFKPIPGALITGENAACGDCLGFREDKVHDSHGKVARRAGDAAAEPALTKRQMRRLRAGVLD
jgi:hypothetical protein